MRITEHIKRGAMAVGGWIPDAFMTGGASAVAYGVSLVYPPAGFIVAGAFLLAAGWLLSRGGR